MRKFAIFLSAFILVSLQGGCGRSPRTQPRLPSASAAKGGFPIEVKDDLGRKIIIKQPPRRIVCLVPSLTEIVFALGLGDRVVGVCEYSDYPPAALKIPLIGRHDRPSIEKITALKPDLVLLGFGNPRELLSTLEGVGLTAYSLDPRNIQEVISAIERVGKICGVPASAEQIAADLKSRMAKMRKLIGNKGRQRPRVFIMIDEEPLWTVGADTLQDEILRLAGGVNVAANRSSYFAYSKESLFADKPDALLIGVKPQQIEATRKRLFARKDLQTLNAIRKGHIIIMDADTFSRPGPRAVDAVEQLYELLQRLPRSEGESP